MKVSVISRHPSHKNFDFPEFDKKVRIRFGSTTEFRSQKDIEFPTKEAILNTSNKFKMKKLFDAGDVKSPLWMAFFPSVISNYVLDPTALRNENDIGKLFTTSDGKLVPRFELIFKELNHSRGEGIMFINNHQDILDVIANGKKGYVEQVISNNREFRVHVCGENAFYVDEKIPREESHTAKIKNLANGYKYRNRSISNPYPSAIKEESIKAVKALSMEFGAVDVAIGVDGEINVFEVNSAMGLRTKTRELYQQQLIELIISKGATII